MITMFRPVSSFALCLLAAIFLPLRFPPAQKLPDTTRLLRFPTTNGSRSFSATRANFTPSAKMAASPVA